MRRSGRRILLGDNTGGGADVFSRLSVLEISDDEQNLRDAQSSTYYYYYFYYYYYYYYYYYC
jgi:hypothetical protein